MLERLKTALVDSLVGAIVVGMLFAQGFAGLARITVSPFTVWLQQHVNPESYDPAVDQRALLIQTMLPQLLISVFTLLIGYVLLRWLYYLDPLDVNEEESPDFEQDE
jgi:hypothetical protein